MKKPFAKFIDKLEGNLPPEGIEYIPKGRTPDLHYNGEWFSGTITGSREDEEEHYDEDDEDYDEDDEDDEDYEEDYEEVVPYNRDEGSW
jgi:hypothetical protein